MNLMKSNSGRLLLTALASVVFVSSAFAADYKVDPTHSRVGFTIKHLVGKVKGEFKAFEGTFKFDPASLGDASGKFTVKMDSINTNEPKRDGHLKSPDFFDVKKYPEMTLGKVAITQGSDKDKYKMTGDLTLHGVTKPVSFDVEYGGLAKDPWGNMRAGFSATGKINRKDFGIVWNKTLDAGGLMLGEDVSIDLEVEAIQAPAVAAK